MCLFICALWSPVGKGLTPWLSFVSLSLSHWYPGSGVVLDRMIPDLCILTYYSGPLLHVYSGDVDLNQIMLKDPIVFGITKEKVKCILCAPNVSVYFVCIYNALEQKKSRPVS